MGAEELEALRALALDVNSRVTGRHQETGMEAFMPEKLPGDTVLRLLAEREALLTSLRAVYEKLVKADWPDFDNQMDDAKAALTLAES